LIPDDKVTFSLGAQMLLQIHLPISTTFEWALQLDQGFPKKESFVNKF